MTNYDERLDEILTKLENAVALNIGSQGMRGEAPKHSHWKSKQAITSLTKELVAEARIDELKHLTDDDGIWYQDMARQFPQKITLNQRIKELEAWTN